VNDGLVLLVRRRVPEGELSWQFPAGEIEPGESDADAAVREAREEVGLIVRPTTRLGERTHPITGRNLCYVVCEVVTGTANVADREELTDVAWCNRTRLGEYVPSPLHAPVQDYLDVNLTA
jgi:8-oxo-dGTP pyrophosphatase MutT (NUDIX family)